MKLSTTKHGLRALLAGFFLFGLMLFFAGQAQAQNINYNWKQSDQARNDLGTAVKTLHGQIPNLSGQPLNDAKSKVYYYKELIQVIATGTEIPVAIPACLHIFDDPGAMTTGKPDDVVVDDALRTKLRTDAINLLKL